MDRFFTRNGASSATATEQRKTTKPGRVVQNTSRVTAAAIVATLMSGYSGIASAQAPTWFGKAADGTWLVGGKIGTLQNGLDAYTDAQTFTLMLGYEFTRTVAHTGSAAIEIELTTTYDSGGIKDTIYEWDADNIAAFMTYRTPGDIYFKAKLGIYSSDVEVKKFDEFEGSLTDTAFGYGMGLGFRFKSNVNVELEFTGNGSDRINDLSGLSIGVHVGF